MDYKVSYTPKNGFTKIARLGDGELKLSEFGLIMLEDGETFSANAGGFEVALVILQGFCDVKGDGFDFPNLGRRASVFDGKPYAVYVPRNKNYQITARGHVEIAWTDSPTDKDFAPFVVTPEHVIDATMAAGTACERVAYHIITDKHETNHFYIGEAFVEDGKHASYPPHRHDFDNWPTEVDMEEIYFFRFSPKQGYGIQKIYSDDRSLDVTYTVEENDTTLIPRGYHPVSTIPGYKMYYLWVMAGKNYRAFKSVFDPAHAWFAKK